MQKNTSSYKVSTKSFMPYSLKRTLDAIAHDPDLRDLQLSAACLAALKQVAADYPLLAAREMIDLAFLREHRRETVGRTMLLRNGVLGAVPDAVTRMPNLFQQSLAESNGKPFAFDGRRLRTLHFDGRSIQSAMWLAAPDLLALQYTKMMMGFLLFHPAPRHILMVGLGGGSLAKYCYQFLPTTRITVIEIDPDVIALRRQFLVPDDDDRLSIVCADALDYIATAEADVDIVMLDGFDAQGMVEALSTRSFFQDCARLLNPGGVLVMNLWGHSTDNAVSITELDRLFHGQVWWDTAIDSGNLVIFAVNCPRHSHDAQSLRSRAVGLDARFALQLNKLAAGLLKYS